MSSLSGCFLVARPVLADPNFRQSVVLLLQHNDEGAFGLVVNRPSEVDGVPFPVYWGGPCPPPGLMMIHGHDDWLPEEQAEETTHREVAPGIFMGDEAAVRRATELAEEGENRFRIFSGYSGWGSGQLEGELAAGAWAVVKAHGDVLFESPAEELWRSLTPPAIPQPSLN